MIEVPIQFYQGETYIPPAIAYVDQNGAPVNLTNYTATFTIRQTTGSTNPAILVATTGNGEITIDGPNGLIQISIPASVTALLAAPFEGVWDLWIYGPANVPSTRLVGGNASILLPVTR